MKVIGLGGFLLALMAGIVILGVAAIGAGERDFESYAEEQFPAFNDLFHVDRDLFRAQYELQRAFFHGEEETRLASIDGFENEVERIRARWNSYRSSSLMLPGEAALQADHEVSRAAWLRMAGDLAELASEGEAHDDPGVISRLEELDGLFFDAREPVHELYEEFYEPLVEVGANRSQPDVRPLLLTLLTVGFLTGISATALVSRQTRRQQEELRSHHSQEEQRASEAQARFRALVEGAHNLITVVSDDQPLEVMGENLKEMSDFASTDRPASMAELLPSSALPAWEKADHELRNGGRRLIIELQAERTDETVAYLEAHGRLLGTDRSERVWVFNDVTAQKRLEEALAHRAFHDSLTGLPNRALLLDRTSHALSLATRSSNPVSMLFCDLDGFKGVNDGLGHERGDELLCAVAERIRSCIRETDTLARFGGDEFVVLVEDTPRPEVIGIAERIVEVVDQELQVADRPLFPSISVGIAEARPGTTAGELIRMADISMYTAKSSGKGRVHFYDEGAGTDSADLLELQGDLRRALDDDQFELHFQPTLGLVDGLVEGVEALIRWSHPTRGQVSPASFIPLAEASGAIVSIGRWVLARACQTAAELERNRGQRLMMHVNLSPHQLRDPHIVATVRAALEEADLDPTLLVLEITEGVLLDDANAIERLEELSALGVKTAIDDFGTGYASISYLQRLPIDILKIDRSFVSGDALPPAERQAFLRTILDLGRNLRVDTIAEGIETTDQLAELRALGCDYGQGFLWSPGLPYESLLDFLNGHGSSDVSPTSSMARSASD